MLFIVLASYPRAQMIDVVILILILSLRFPVKRLSTHKRELKEKNAKKPVKETPPSQRARGRQRMKPQQQDEEEEEEEDEEEEVLSQSLRKRDKNIQENKAMVMNQQPLGVFSTFSLSHVLHSSLLLPFSWPSCLLIWAPWLTSLCPPPLQWVLLLLTITSARPQYISPHWLKRNTKHNNEKYSKRHKRC